MLQNPNATADVKVNANAKMMNTTNLSPSAGVKVKAHAVERDARNLLHHTQTLTGEVREIIAGTRDLALDSAGLATQIAKDAAMFGVGTATSAVSATTGLTMHVANEIYKRTAEPFVRHLTQGMDSTNVTDNLVAAKEQAMLDAERGLKTTVGGAVELGNKAAEAGCAAKDSMYDSASTVAEKGKQMTSDMANKMQDYEATGDVAMNRAASTMRDTTEPLREKAKEAMEKSRSSGEEMMQASRATGERLASDVHDKGSELLDKARGTGQQLMESTEDAASYAKDKVKQGKESAESTGKGMANIATDKVRQGADAASRKANDMAGAAKTTMATDTTNMTTTTNGMQYTPAPDTILLEVKTDGRPLVVDGKHVNATPMIVRTSAANEKMEPTGTSAKSAYVKRV